MKRMELVDWVVREIESKYKEDVCLLFGYGGLTLEKDLGGLAFPSCYIPRTSRSNGLSRTFIINGQGFDLYPRSWENLEKFADVKEYNSTCLGGAEIIWARTEDDRKRFLSLQARLQANLQNPHLMYKRAVEYSDAAADAYQAMLFAEKLYKVRENAWRVCDLSSLAIAFVNGRYFEHGQTSQIKEFQSMDSVPAGFTDLYERIIRAKEPEEQKRLCHDMIAVTKAFLAEHDKCKAPRVSEPDFTELADWYQELSYTWRRIYHFCDANDPVNTYAWCCLLQEEVDLLGTEFGIEDLDIYSAYDADNLPALRARAEAVEKAFVSAIESHGVTIDSYSSVEEFLQKNP